MDESFFDGMFPGSASTVGRCRPLAFDRRTVSLTQFYTILYLFYHILPLVHAPTLGCAGFDTAICGGLNMNAYWEAIFWVVPVWTFLMIPFMTFYYEADDGTLMAGTAYAPNVVKKSRLCQALCYEIFVVILVGLIMGIFYATLSTSHIPVQEYFGLGQNGQGIGRITTTNQNLLRFVIPRVNETIKQANGTDVYLPMELNQLDNWDARDTAWLNTVKAKDGTDTISLTVSVATFWGGLMAWFGWFVFCIFGGIGLTAMPLDLILAFKNRPKHMDAVEFAEAQVSLRERTNELVEIGEMIKIERDEKEQAGMTSNFGTWSMDRDTRKAAKDEKQALLGFKQAVYLLEKDVEDFQAVATNYENYNPLIPYFCLLLGIIAIVVSFIWFIQIIVYVIPNPPLTPLLNSYFKWFDSWFPLFGVLSVALFTVYLLLCGLKGCFKFGLRFLFFQIHPMKVGKTYMSSFLFNTGLVILCAMPVVQLCQDAFADYAAFANIRQIFGVQIYYLTFFGVFWQNNIFVYVFLVISILTALYLWCKPRDQSANPEALRDRLRSRKAGAGGDAGASASSGGNGASQSMRQSSRSSREI